MISLTNTIPRIYIRNINEKVGLNTLKLKLLETFSKFKPQSVTAHKNLKMRGQAFITFEDSKQAKKALSLNGATMFNQKIEVKLAKTSSNQSLQKNLSREEYAVYEQQRKKQKEKDSAIVVLNTPPHKILLIQNLPDGITKDELLPFFNKYKGFVDITLVAVKKVAFINFESEEDAIPAKQGNKDLQIRGEKIIVNYAKK